MRFKAFWVYSLGPPPLPPSLSQEAAAFDDAVDLCGCSFPTPELEQQGQLLGALGAWGIRLRVEGFGE